MPSQPQRSAASGDIVRGRLSAAARDVELPTPAFSFRIGWAGDYESLFKGDRVEVTGTAELPERAMSSGRVILHGRGGGAKTVIIRRLQRDLLSVPHVLPFFIDLKKWVQVDYAAWQRCPALADRIDFLLTRFCDADLGIIVLDALPPDIHRLLLVDGLNEVYSSTAQKIVDALEEYVRLGISTSTIITDRIVRREFHRPTRWRLGLVLPVDDQQIRALFDKVGRKDLFDSADPSTRALLGTPYFLNAALKDGRTGRAGSVVHYNYFVQHASLTPDELAAASAAAFDMYVENAARTFSLDAFRAMAGRESTRKLLEAQAIIIRDDEACFSHHLKHDYLAARHLAASRDRWRYEDFARITFHANSFEAIAIALELLTNTEDADAFVRTVYDWNQYGAAYAVAEGRHANTIAVSQEMEVVLLAMLADRRWDIIATTARRVTDALNLFPSKQARRFREASDPERVTSLVNEVETRDPAFLAWRDLFTRPRGSAAADRDLELVDDRDSLLGWTIANVLKRMQVNENQQAALRKRLSTTDGVSVRWRIVHALGAMPSQANVEALLAVLKDRDPKYELVRFGAIRSLVEMAAWADAALREIIFTRLKELIRFVAAEPRVIQEFERAIFVQKRYAPSGWNDDVLDLLAILRTYDETVDRVGRWDDTSFRFSREYGS